jgi:hypothetical protein
MTQTDATLVAAPSIQLIGAKLTLLNRAKTHYAAASTPDDKALASQTFWTCWQWFKQRGIALTQNPNNGFWVLDKTARRRSWL